MTVRLKPWFDVHSTQYKL